MLQESEIIRIDQSNIVFIMKSVKEIYLLNSWIRVLEYQGSVEHRMLLSVHIFIGIKHLCCDMYGV
jgi:hypothetical protein